MTNDTRFALAQKRWDDMTPEEDRRDERVYRVRASFDFEVDIPGLELPGEIEEYLRDHADEIVEHTAAKLTGWEEVEEDGDENP